MGTSEPARRGRGRPKSVPDLAFQARLRQAIGPRSKNSVAKAAGLSEGLLRGYLTGMQPGGDKLIRLASVLAVSLEWLATGNGPAPALASADSAFLSADLVQVPLYPVELGAGPGRTVWPAGDPIGRYPLPTATLRASGLPLQAMAGFTVRGTSMEPQIRDGEIAILDLSRTVLPPDAHGTYGIRLDDELSLKRLRWVDGDLEISSVNAGEFPPRRLAPHEAERLQVIGRFWASFDARPRTVQD